MKIDQIMIKEIMSVSDVGQYAAALRISEAWYFIPIVICSSLFPAIIHAKEIDENLYLNRLQKLYSLMIWIGITVSILITFLGTSIIDILYGDQYYESASVLIIHIWAGVFVFLGVAFNKFLTVENFAIKTFYRTFSGAILNIILNLYLIPKYGINGAAIATLCSQLFTGLLIDIFDKELRKYFKFKLLAFNPLVLIK